MAHHQHPNRAFRPDHPPRWTSLGHGHDVECRSRTVLDVRLPRGPHSNQALQQHVERVGRPTCDGQDLARRRLDCVSLRRQEAEFALAATGEEIDASEHLDLGAGLRREMQHVNQRMPTPSCQRLKLVREARLCATGDLGVLGGDNLSTEQAVLLASSSCPPVEHQSRLLN